MNNTSKNEGMWDRLSAGWTGVKTAASNIGATAAGTPAKITNVNDAKIKKLFNNTQLRMKPFVKNLKSTNIVTKTAAEIEVKKQLLGFFQDFMKMTNEKNPNSIITTLQQPQYKDISDYLTTKIGMDLKNISSKTSPKLSPKPITKTTSKSITSKPVNITRPKHAAKFNGFTFDDTTGLWSDSKGNVLNKNQSDVKTNAYVAAVNSGKLIPENITKITYKEFFV